MARQNELDRRGGSWRDLALAAVAAAAVTLLLVASVGIVWLTGRTPSQSPVLVVRNSSTPTPTPRALAFIQITPTPAPTPEAAPPETAVAALDNTAITVVATPDLLVLSSESGLPAATGAGTFTSFKAPGDADFAALASGSWTASENRLINAGDTAVAEPWLAVPAAPDTDFAIEAEIRVDGLLPSVCDQSFGLVGGSPDAGVMYGGGLLFPCGSDAPRARLTDAAVWEDGYNADPSLAEESFDPGEDWHLYRLEVRGDKLRLMVDGKPVVTGAPATVIDLTSTKAETGLWAQGVDLEVRKISVEPLPPD